MLRLDGLVLVDHTFQLPLDHDGADAGEIEVFAREVRAAEEGAEQRPWLVYLQGGPGFESPRPMGKEGWIGKAVDRYRVLLLDQRGTGRSTPQTVSTITAAGDAAAQAQHLARFRADSIVRDCERIREALGVERWTLLGQSFGGFCAVHYLSSAPDSLAGVMITGGLPGLDVHADDVYRRTFPLTAAKNRAMEERFPAAATNALAIHRRLAEGDVRLPSGDPLTPERFQALGLQLGFSRGATELHFLMERAFEAGSAELTLSFLRGVENLQSFDTNPFYALIHEACYAQGPATAWAAQRVRQEFPGFDAAAALAEGRAPSFTGEMVFPWVFEQFGALCPLREAADLVAAKADWPRLYDEAQLACNEVPVSALVYHDDMFVPTDLSLRTADRIRGARAWVTNEFEHDGLRSKGGEIFERLQGRLDG